MKTTIVRRLMLLVPVLLVVSSGVFAMIHLVPGDAAAIVAGPEATPERYQQIREQMHLNEPLVQQYVTWLGQAVQFDFGRSLVPPTEDVARRLARALPVNLELTVLALTLALVVSVPLALWSSARPGGRLDRAVSMATFALLSLPSFLAAILVVLLLTVNWQLFPVGQWVRPSDGGWLENLRHAFLPAVTLSLYPGAVFTRLLRSDLVATLQEDYILAARAMGMPRRHVLWRQALRPSSFSLITVVGITLGELLGGSLIIEQVFSLPGLGQTILGAVQVQDFPVVQAGVLFIAVIYVGANLFVDIAYTFIDPRIRRGNNRS